VSNDLMLGIYN